MNMPRPATAFSILITVLFLPFTLRAAPKPATDSIVQVVAEAKGLSLVQYEQLPFHGTFWVVSASIPCIIAPMPCPPMDPTLPVYAIGDRQFLVDDTRGQIVSRQHRSSKSLSAGQMVELQAIELLNHIEWIQREDRTSEESVLSLDGPPAILGEGESGGPAFDPPVHTTNELYLTIGPATNSAVQLLIHPPWNTTNGVYDLFSTTNLTPSWWQWELRTSPGQINLTNPASSSTVFFLLGQTNDLDNGGLTDAYEGLLGLNPNEAGDDRITPLVSIYATDSVASEQESTNSASFSITRLGGQMGAPLTLSCALSGSGEIWVNYVLEPADALTFTSSNLLVRIPADQTNLTLTVTPIDNHESDGTKTATLTVQTSSDWEVNSSHASATAWILETYTKTYTSLADFKQGVLDGMEAVSGSQNGQLQFKADLPQQFPFINVACSDRGTVVRINTTNGTTLGEYRTSPFGLPQPPSPSRTTVDQYGNVWVANRADTLDISGTNWGSITRIGLIIGGSRFDKIETNYVANDNGQYVALSNVAYNTCLDRDGDGFIRTSSGLTDILAWNNSSLADSKGGVSTAQDEAITEYTRVPCTGTRTIAVDKFNDIWVGGNEGARTHLKVNGLLALPVNNSAFDASGVGGYGGVIDSLGNLWSSDGTGLVWLTPPPTFPPLQNIDWHALLPPDTTAPYGIAVDPVHPYIWQTTGGYVFRWFTNGIPETDGGGNVILYGHGQTSSQGLAVDARGDVWVAHGRRAGMYGSDTVGHIYTNGALIGSVQFYNSGLWAEYFGTTNLVGLPLTNHYEQTSISYSNAWPEAPVPASCFSARWSGTVQPTIQGDHVFYVKAEAGAAFRLQVNGTIVIDNWTNPVPGSVELAGTVWLGTNIAYDLRLEYIHFSGDPLMSLSWMEPGAIKEVVPAERFNSGSSGATGISIDPAGKIWAGCYDSSTIVRIDPNAGRIVLFTNTIAGVTTIITNHVGLVDMVINLGDGTWHPEPYDKSAGPYNYSDMTGFNGRVVNPTLKPLKGYWVFVNDSGNQGQRWNKVSWNAALTSGCLIEVFVRASDDRNELGSEVFTPVTNNTYFAEIRGRYIEVRLAMVRDNPSKQPLIYDLTLHGVSSGFDGDFFIDDARAYELQDATFVANLVGAEPLGYQWFRMYPWETNWVQVAGATNAAFTVTNVDSWVDWTGAKVLVTNANGESMWLGPALVEMWALPIGIPAYGSSGPASQYPATINVFGQPTNLDVVTVTLFGLSHTRSADLNVLLVSPSDKRIMLISNVGGTNGVLNASLAFRQPWPYPPTSGAILSGTISAYRASNYAQRTTIPGAPSGPYSVNLSDLTGENPNGEWKLYIYDGAQPGGVGQLTGSWRLDFTYQ